MISGKTYPSTYQSANNMLRRMEQRKEVKVHALKKKFGIADMFMLPSTSRLKSTDKVLHEIAGGDLFVALNPYIKRWAYEPIVGSKRADRGAQFENGLTIYPEVDMMTENISVLFDKVENYIAYSKAAGERFHVIFAFVGTQERIQKRGEKLIPFLQSKRRGDQFLLVNHNKWVADPMGRVLYSPRNEILSLNML